MEERALLRADTEAARLLARKVLISPSLSPVSHLFPDLPASAIFHIQVEAERDAGSEQTARLQHRLLQLEELCREQEESREEPGSCDRCSGLERDIAELRTVQVGDLLLS